MPSLYRACVRLSLALLVLAAGCDDPAELAQEINAAREGCTEEKLRAGDEECVRMMQRYAEMGTEAMQTYIGAVKSLDQALQRMPPAQFDTAGLGHAISSAIATAPGWTGDSLGTAAPSAPAMARGYAGGGQYDTRGGWNEPRQFERDRGSDGPGSDPRGEHPARGGYSRERSYDGDGEWDRRDSRSGDWNARSGSPPRPGYEPDPRARERWLDGWSDAPGGRDARPRGEPAPAPRGGLLPPEQRLHRPWLREAGPGDRDPRYRARGPQGYLPARPYPDSLEEEGLPPDPRRRYQHP